MPKSTRELVLEAIDRLQIFEAGQEVPAENYAKVKGKVFPLLAWLKAERVLDIFVNPQDEDSQDVPDHVFIPLAMALANEAAPAFGLPHSSMPSRDGTWDPLHRAVAEGPQYFRQTAEYY